MTKYNLFFVCIVLSCFLGCQQQTPESVQEVTEAMFATGPQLVKIEASGSAVANSLIEQGIEVIVQEKDYLIVRMNAEQAVQAQSQMLTLQKISESDLVQRLVRIVVTDKSVMPELNEIGITIWEVKGDTVVAQAYDNYIRDIKAKGLEVEVIEDNILNTAKDVSQK